MCALGHGFYEEWTHQHEMHNELLKLLRDAKRTLEEVLHDEQDSEEEEESEDEVLHDEQERLRHLIPAVESSLMQRRVSQRRTISRREDSEEEEESVEEEGEEEDGEEEESEEEESEEEGH